MRKLVTLVTVWLLGFAIAQAQTRSINGKVVDVNGQPLGGASIQIKGMTGGTAADAEGKFKITAKTGDVLVISTVGYTTQEVTVNNRSSYNVTLSSATSTIDEVVVTAVGIKRTEKALGYSIAKVDPNALLQKSEPDVLKGLQGKVAGVDIRQSQGTPGAATRIQIRGNSSFFGDNQPLIIVDGLPYSNDQVTTSNQTSGGSAYSSGFANLDPNDIATMNVLKGAAAAAIYGSRAASGVIIITTKSGSAARSRKGMEINVKSGVSFETIANLPDYQNEYGAGSQMNYSNSNGSWGPAFSSLDSIPAWPTYLAAYPELFPSSGNVAYKAYPNNVKNLFRTGTVWENSIGFTGGDDKSSVAVTASQLNHKGYVPGSFYNRSNIGLGGSTKLNSGITVRGNFSYVRSVQEGGYYGENQVDGAASLFARSLFLARNWDMDLPYQDKLGNSITHPGGGQFDNPIWSAINNVARTEEERIIAGLHLDYNFTPWARIDYNFGSNVNTLARSERTEISSRAAEGLGRLVIENYRKQEIESNLVLTFTPTISKDFSFKGVVGHQYNQRTTTDEVNTGNRFVTRGVYTLKNTAQQKFNTDDYIRRRLIGVYGDVTFGYKNFAFISATGRNDFSSTLPSNSRSYFYPSVSGSLVFTDAFNLKSDVLSFGKVRAAWAKVGKDADPYSLQNTFLITPSFLGQPTGTANNQANNADLKPEFTKEIELGAQLGFFKGRIDLDFTYYKRNSTNQIAPVSTPASSGYQYKVMNFGEVSNKGVEIDLRIRPIVTSNFRWEVAGIFTKNKNMVEKLMPGVERIPLFNVLTEVSPYLEAGKPFGYLRGTKSLRDDEGNLLINPSTGGMIVGSEQDMIGDPNPDFKLGINNSFSYKGFFANALFDMTKGGDIYSVTISSLLGRGVTKDTRDRTASWIIPGVYGDPNTGEAILVDGKKVKNQTRITTNDLYFSPNPTNGATFAINTATEWNVYDATVYRLREVNLGYEFPKAWFKSWPIGSLSLSVTGRNLWHLAPNVPRYTNFDPEVNSFGATATQGIELSAAPTTRRYGINLNVTF